MYCKRIVGLPGDTVSAVNGYVKNNNHKGLLGNEARQKQLSGKTRRELERFNVYDVVPRHDGHFSWNIKDWGPLYVPRKGDIIKLSPREAVLYRKILEWETGKHITWNWDNGSVYAGGRRVTRHRFKHNYHHLSGDYAPDSFGSRYWGFVLEEYKIKSNNTIYLTCYLILIRYERLII